MTELKIYFLEEREKEICMFGDYVGIIYDLVGVAKTTVNESGQKQRTITFKRTGEYYIGFPIIRGSEDDYYLDDDKSIDGGLTLEIARQVAQELVAAVEYLEAKE